MRHIDDWMNSYTASESLDISRDLALSHASQGGIVGRQIAALIRKDNLRAICEFELPSYDDPVWGPLEGPQEEHKGEDPTLVDWESIEDEGLREEVVDGWIRRRAETIRHCRQALAFFQKLGDLEIGIKKEEVAFEKFLEAEEACWVTNKLFRDARAGVVSFPPRVCGVLHAARVKIAQVLGKVPSLGELNLRFGPGATRGVKRKDANTRSKVSESPSCSEDLIGMAPAILGELPVYTSLHQKGEFDVVYLTPEGGVDMSEVWALVDLEVQDSRLGFVPKNYKTCRSVCIEPSLNVLYQGGIGEHLAMRLRKFGVDVRDQTRNQRLAKLGSLTGALATLDLSMASDTVATELVAELLPPDWFEVLRRARTVCVQCTDPATGRTYRIRQEKFSSMGNGFTFPLETLIFYALSRAAVDAVVGPKGIVSVYGDDIIVPSTAYSHVAEILHTCGFTVNQSKSYSTGLFRESCGTDWYGGIDVRPYYSKEWWSPRNLFVLHNFYVRTGDLVRSKEVEKRIHPDLQIYGPDGFGDGHLIGDFEPIRSRRHVERGFGGYTFATYQVKSPTDNTEGEYEIGVALYAAYQRKAASRRFTITTLGKTTLEALQWRFNRGHGVFGDSGTPLPEKKGRKCLDLPGHDGYRKISIYTFG